jgi:hypothetical protein
LATNVIDIQGCRNTTEVQLTVSNLGEIATTQLVTVPITASGHQANFDCNYNDPTPWCQQNAPTQFTPFIVSATFSFQAVLDGGETQEVLVPVNFGFPAFLSPFNAKATAGNYQETPIVQSLVETFPSVTPFCFPN